MSKDPANLEKALAKKARKQAKKDELRTKKARVSGFVAPEVLSVKGAENWELSTCWITSGWKDTQGICQALITRKHSNGRVAAAVFVVDLACLGVKNASVNAFISEYEFSSQYLEILESTQELEVCSGDLIAKVVHIAIDYARSLGFEPHPDAKKALLFLHDLKPENVPDRIPTGDGRGRPVFIQGPYDNVKKVLKTLDKSVGEGNYEFVSAVDMFGDDDDDLDPDEFMDLLENLDDDELLDLLDQAGQSTDDETDSKTIDVQAKKTE
jgi:hypothetical protein